tara:strand:- start:24 stop:194 length:171 start_codon:yes stop_codon:yes gene_type:complete
MLDIIIRDAGYRVLSKTAEAFSGAVHKEIRKFNRMSQPAKKKRTTKRTTSRRINKR